MPILISPTPIWFAIWFTLVRPLEHCLFTVFRLIVSGIPTCSRTGCICSSPPTGRVNLSDADVLDELGIETSGGVYGTEKVRKGKLEVCILGGVFVSFGDGNAYGRREVPGCLGEAGYCQTCSSFRALSRNDSSTNPKVLSGAPLDNDNYSFPWVHTRRLLEFLRDCTLNLAQMIVKSKCHPYGCAACGSTGHDESEHSE
ncbi:hypothetical protein H2248_011858 [Termitomyces sp. 'cryptogamus']|nr:hypothetical protein H2248_011858 [Termitomyces sp. 'cryptogamus']